MTRQDFKFHGLKVSGRETRNVKREAILLAARLLALMAVVVLLLGAGDDSSRFDKLGHKMMCRCGCNQVLLECNHVGCEYSERMRGELKEAMLRGDSDDLILQGFVQKYGPTVLAAPATSGFDFVAWIMPFAALSVGLLLVVFVVRTWNRRRAATAAASTLSPAVLDSFRQRAREETEI